MESMNSDLLFLIVFPFLWVAIIGLVSFIGGWHKLAGKYAFDDYRLNEIKIFRFQSIRLGIFTNYDGIMNISVYKNGIKLKPNIVFSFMHKAILIPWEDIHVEKSGRRYIRFTANEKRIIIKGRVVNYIFENDYIK